jgi:hypothetical protein
VLLEEDTTMLEAKANMGMLLEEEGMEDKGKEDTPCNSREEEAITTTVGNKVVLTVEHKAGMLELLEDMEVSSLRGTTISPHRKDSTAILASRMAGRVVSSRLIPTTMTML